MDLNDEQKERGKCFHPLTWDGPAVQVGEQRLIRPTSNTDCNTHADTQTELTTHRLQSRDEAPKKLFNLSLRGQEAFRQRDWMLTLLEISSAEFVSKPGETDRRNVWDVPVCPGQAHFLSLVVSVSPGKEHLLPNCSQRGVLVVMQGLHSMAGEQSSGCLKTSIKEREHLIYKDDGKKNQQLASNGKNHSFTVFVLLTVFVNMITFMFTVIYISH